VGVRDQVSAGDTNPLRVAHGQRAEQASTGDFSNRIQVAQGRRAEQDFAGFKLQQLLLKRQSLDSYFVGSGSKQTSAGHVVAVGLSPEDLLDPTRIESLLASMRQHPDKAAAAVNLVTGMGQNISDAFKLVDPTFTPAVAGPVAGLAIIGSSANFWQEMLGDDTMGKVMKGTVFVANRRFPHHNGDHP
jgi:hypothetical protein